jgi:hypothetical protein
MKNKNDKNKNINEKKIERATRRVNSIDILPAKKNTFCGSSSKYQLRGSLNNNKYTNA